MMIRDILSQVALLALGNVSQQSLKDEEKKGKKKTSSNEEVGKARMFRSMFETYEVALEVYIADQLVQKQTMQAPKELIMVNFMQLAKQIQNDSRPMKIRVVRPEVIWDSFENKEKVLYNEVVASNNAMVAWTEENQKKDEG